MSANLRFSCDRCREPKIIGARWHCLRCYHYDLCDPCYKQGHHSWTHEFVRISSHGEIKAVAPRKQKDLSVTGRSWFCDGCMDDKCPIRWKCSVCLNYDLCTKCYNRGEHIMSHPFQKITQHSSSLQPPRIQSHGAGAAAMIAELCLDDTQPLELEVLPTSHEDYCIVENYIKSTKNAQLVRGIVINPRFHILKIKKVRNILLWKRYRNYRTMIMKENAEVYEKCLFHGSPNIDKIIKNGFDERRGKGMFGYGVYFARNSTKSNKYVFGCQAGCPSHNDLWCTTCTRQMLFCRVSLGKCYIAPSCKEFPHPPAGFNSVMGKARHTKGIVQDEYVIYRGEQAYPAYVIEYKLLI